MNIEQLYAMASARGMSLDFGKPKREIPVEHRRPPRRRPDGTPGQLTAQGAQTRTRRAPEWSATDLGHAAQGMPDLFWRALCWCIGSDEQARVYIKAKLLEIAVRRKEIQVWPEAIRRGTCGDCGMLRCSHKYVEDLVTMALLEGAHPQMFASEADRARHFGLSETHWRRIMMVRYYELLTELHRWYNAAEGYIRRRLKEREDAAEPATANQ